MPFGDLRLSGLRLSDELGRLGDQVDAALRDRRIEQIGDDVAASLETLRLRIEAGFEDGRDALGDLFRDDPEEAPAAQDDAAVLFEAGTLRELFDRYGLGDVAIAGDIGGLDDLAGLATRLPDDPGGPAELPTGGGTIGRAEALVATQLAATARIVDALGPTAETLEIEGQAFAVQRSYADPLTGFSGLRLSPVAGGPEVFVVDGLEVGSRPDEVAALTLGRLQLGSEAFGEMLADAVAVGAVEGRQVLFTGPSLGGSIVQAAAHQTAQALLEAGVDPAPGAVRLVTVDGLGGRDAAEWLNGGALDPGALSVIAALNLRTEGDIVSRIGGQVGPTLTLPAVDAAGNPVGLSPAEAHVNAVSLLEVLSSDALFAAARPGAADEIGAFAAVSEAAADELVAAWLASGEPDAAQRPLQITGTAGFDASGTAWSLDADDDGTTDVTVRLAAPVSPVVADLVLG